MADILIDNDLLRRMVYGLAGEFQIQDPINAGFRRDGRCKLTKVFPAQDILPARTVFLKSERLPDKGELRLVASMTTSRNDFRFVANATLDRETRLLTVKKEVWRLGAAGNRCVAELVSPVRLVNEGERVAETMIQGVVRAADELKADRPLLNWGSQWFRPVKTAARSAPVHCFLVATAFISLMLYLKLRERYGKPL